MTWQDDERRLAAFGLDNWAAQAEKLANELSRYTVHARRQNMELSQKIDLLRGVAGELREKAEIVRTTPFKFAVNE